MFRAAIGAHSLVGRSAADTTDAENRLSVAVLLTDWPRKHELLRTVMAAWARVRLPLHWHPG